MPHWSILEQRSFDAWGSLTHLKTKNGLFTTEQAILNEILQNGLILDRGYTGHEHLWMVGIVNMNGRLYDPALKRFLSPDNFIQDPYNTQNFNRYGYVLNNPLIYTDPSGEEIFTFLFLALATIIEAALPPALIGAAIAIGTTMLSNAIAGNPLHWGIGKAAAFGALSGVVSAGIGSIASTMGPSKFLFQAGMHGYSGGVFSVLSGGDFGSGFAAGFVSSLVSSGVQALGPREVTKFNFSMDGNHTRETIIKGIQSKALMDALTITAGGLSGGISASLSGGKFWDGARQGLITSGLNHVMHSAMRNGPGDGDPPCTMPDGSPCLYIYPEKVTIENSKLALDVGGGVYGSLENLATPGNRWLGINGKYYDKSWGGNQYTGSRSGAYKAANLYKWGGRATLFGSAVYGGIDTYNGYQRDGGQFGYNFQHAAASNTGSLVGGWAGAEIGAKSFFIFGGLIFGPPGAVGGAVIGGLVGGFGGGYLGGQLGGGLINYNYTR